MAWVKFVREGIEIEVNAGMSVLEAEIRAGLRPDAPCGGLGKCGKCLVKINGEVVKVYTYVIDNTEYVISDDDQSIAGAFWKKQAVCAGYAGAVQYLLERLDIPCIYVEGDAANSTQGHAWNIVELNGQYYYVDATNGDQPDFLEGDATLLAEHKTTIYDFFCFFHFFSHLFPVHISLLSKPEVVFLIFTTIRYLMTDP